MFDDESMIIVHVGYAWDGWTFALSPWTRHRLGETKSYRSPRIFIGNDDPSNTDPRHLAHVDDGLAH